MNGLIKIAIVFLQGTKKGEMKNEEVDRGCGLLGNNDRIIRNPIASRSVY